MQERKIAAIILYNRNKKVLMQHRGEDAPRWPGYWGLFGGGVEDGETHEEALRRELLEEIEYTISNPQLLSQETGQYPTGGSFSGNTYIEAYDESQPIVQHEGQGYAWFTIEEALKLKISDSRRQCLLKAREYLKNVA